MRFIIYGAGGVGGVIGAELFKAGVDVVLIARGEHLEAIQTRGLRYENPSEDITLPIAAVGHPGEITPRDDDVVVLTMKTQHTEAALADLMEVRGPDIPVVCCQNGVANERFAARLYRHVYGMCVYMPAQFVEPGRVQGHGHPMRAILDLGLYPHGADERAAEIARHLERADISSRPDPDIMRPKYGKLLMNLGNALAAISPRGPAADAVNAAVREEGRACFAAAGIDWLSDEDMRARREGLLAHGDIKGVERVGGSSIQSLIRGTGDIEADYLNGEIVALGRRHGVPTPANAVVQRFANDLSRSKGAPGSIAIEQVERLIAEAQRQVAQVWDR